MPYIYDLLKYNNNYFVETGTFKGDTIQLLLDTNNSKPTHIISLEISSTLYEESCKKFEGFNNIKIVNGNTKYDLYNHIKDISENITFWLDSHWSNNIDVFSDNETICPILYELDQIKDHFINTHTIIIDDIRLMNNSTNKFIGFNIDLNNIIDKLLKINPNYNIKYYNDNEGINDILVAFPFNVNNFCIHKYLLKCRTNELPPGFGDFLRGTVALYNLSIKYNYNLYIDTNHPIYNYLNPNKKYILNIKSNNIEELLPPLSYNTIHNKLNNLFIENNNFSIITNSMYTMINGNLENYGKINNDCKLFLKEIITPSVEIINYMNNIFLNIYKFDIFDDYNIIHIRFGDNYLFNNILNEDLYNMIYNKINNIIGNNEKFILITDSKIMGNKLKFNIPRILYWNNNKIHLGGLQNTIGIKDTITDFFIMSKCKKIYSNNSGFSLVVSEIFDIPYVVI
jgi:hypothetical protein